MGGINYHCDENINTKSETTTSRNLNNNLNNNLKFLEGSLKEVKAIDSIFKIKYSNSTKLATGCEASKEFLLKQFEAKKAQMIHISTHGLVFNSTQTIKNNKNWYLDAGNRSFIALANGNKGLLSAYEITNYNLNHVDLVFLSACSTGIGPSISGQGLFSIGEAFSSAGAKKIIYTLWDIPDDFAQIFATQFYSIYLKTFDANKALKATQVLFSKTHPPMFWAAYRIIN